ncbi:MAG: hypothetical protein KF799_07330 [Bdellovibrionales bacterium]|nr:hypothetical protein [Bdellovibrionales bacterium]
MMRALILFAVALVASPAFAHSLLPAAGNLMKVAAIIKDGQSSNPATASETRKRLSILWRETLLLPIKSQDKKMTTFGYSLASTPSTFGYHIERNEQAKDRDKELYDFYTFRWTAVLPVIEQQIEDVSALKAFLAEPDSLLSIEWNERRFIEAQLWRLSTLTRFKNYVLDSIHCVEAMSNRYRETGLQPLKMNGEIIWRSTDLHRVYGVGTAHALSKEQQAKMAKDIDSLMTTSAQNDDLCMEPEVLAFFSNEQQRLEGN